MMGLRSAILMLPLATMIGLAGTAGAATISSGSFTVGIGPNGELYDAGAGVGIRRNSDGYDPLQPGTPRDSWGISVQLPGGAGASGYADSQSFGTQNITSSFAGGASAATVSAHFSAPGGAALADVLMLYSFVKPNILKIDTTVKNISGGFLNNVTFQRDIDWDVLPTLFDENSTSHGTVTPWTAGVIQASGYGFENPDPTVNYGNSVLPTGTSTGFGDNGGGIKLALGGLRNGQSKEFDYYYGINMINPDGTAQSEAALIAEAQLVGVGFLVSTVGTDGTHSAFIGVPEPASLALLGAGLAALGLIRRRCAA